MLRSQSLLFLQELLTRLPFQSPPLHFRTDIVPLVIRTFPQWHRKNCQGGDGKNNIKKLKTYDLKETIHLGLRSLAIRKALHSKKLFEDEMWPFLGLNTTSSVFSASQHLKFSSRSKHDTNTVEFGIKMSGSFPALQPAILQNQPHHQKASGGSKRVTYFPIAN